MVTITTGTDTVITEANGGGATEWDRSSENSLAKYDISKNQAEAHASLPNDPSLSDAQNTAVASIYSEFEVVGDNSRGAEFAIDGEFDTQTIAFGGTKAVTAIHALVYNVTNDRKLDKKDIYNAEMSGGGDSQERNYLSTLECELVPGDTYRVIIEVYSYATTGGTPLILAGTAFADTYTNTNSGLLNGGPLNDGSLNDGYVNFSKISVNFEDKLSEKTLVIGENEVFLDSTDGNAYLTTEGRPPINYDTISNFQSASETKVGPLSSGIAEYDLDTNEALVEISVNNGGYLEAVSEVWTDFIAISSTTESGRARFNVDIDYLASVTGVIGVIGGNSVFNFEIECYLFDKTDNVVKDAVTVEQTSEEYGVFEGPKTISLISDILYSHTYKIGIRTSCDARVTGVAPTRPYINNISIDAHRASIPYSVDTNGPRYSKYNSISVDWIESWDKIRGDAQNTAFRSTAGPTEEPGVVWETASRVNTDIIVDDSSVYCGERVSKNSYYISSYSRDSGENEWTLGPFEEQIWNLSLDDNNGNLIFTHRLSSDQPVNGYDVGEIYAVNTGDGSVVWSNYLINSEPTSDVAGSMYHKLGDGKVFTGNVNGEVFAFDLSTGNLIWAVDIGNEYGFQGATLSQDLTSVVVCMSYDGLYSLSTATGDIEWSTTVGYAYAGYPIYVDEKIIHVDDEDLYLRAFDAKSGEEIWNDTSSVWLHPHGNATDGEYIYLEDHTNKELVGYHIDGKNEKFRKPIKTHFDDGGVFSANESDILYFYDRDGYLNAHSKTDGSQIYRTNFGDYHLDTYYDSVGPVVDGEIYVTTTRPSNKLLKIK